MTRAGRHARDWDRALRAANHPQTTRSNYLLAAAQLGRYLAEYSPDPDADAAGNDPTAVTRAHVETFQAWMIDTRSASTAVNKHKCLQQFFRFLVEEQEIDRSPMDRVRQPKTPQKLVPVMRAEDTGRLLAACKGTGFVNLRDEALIRLYCNTGARLSEIGNLRVDDLELNTDSVHLRGKGARDRRGTVRSEDRPRAQPLPARPGQAQGQRAATAVARREGRAAAGAQRDQDPVEAAGRGCWRGWGARAPVAAHLRARVETRGR